MKQINAFDTIAGSSHGLQTPRETAIELIAFCSLYEFKNTGSDVANKKAMSEKLAEFTYELASTGDDEVDSIFEIQEDLANLINDLLPIPPSCRVSLQDNEYVVLPYIDDEVPKVDECPDHFVDDLVYSVNDHGNIDCYQWEVSKQKYVNVWSMV